MNRPNLIVGREYMDREQWTKALNVFKHYTDPEAMTLSGLCHLRLENYTAALDAFTTADRKTPDQPNILNGIGAAFLGMRKLAEAERAFARVTHLDPVNQDALFNLAKVYLETLSPFDTTPNLNNNTVEQCAAVLQRYLTVYPEDSRGFNQAGLLAVMTNDDAKAEAFFKAALMLSPRSVTAMENLAGIFERQARHAEAEKMLSDIIASEPGKMWSNARMKRGRLRLRRGDYENGWHDFEARWTMPGVKPLDSNVPGKHFMDRERWHGGSLAGEVLAVTDEQGLGDSIMFASMIPDLIRRAQVQGGFVLLFTRPELFHVYQRSFGGEPMALRVIECADIRNPVATAKVNDFSFTVACPLGSLGHALRPSAAHFPLQPNWEHHRAQYIRPTFFQEADMRTKLEKLAEGREIVGISWKSFNNHMAAGKSSEIGQWVDLMMDPRRFFVSLQYGDTFNEECLQYSINPIFPRIHFDKAVDGLKDFDGWLAQVAACDRVVTISNVTAHAAAALGKPTHLIVPNALSYAHLWQWGEGGETNPWYPTMTMHHASTAPNDPKWPISALAACKAAIGG